MRAAKASLLAALAAGCIPIEPPLLDGDYVLQGRPGIDLMVTRIDRTDYIYRLCAMGKCQHGSMHVIVAYNGFRGEADFEGSRMESLERDLTRTGREPAVRDPVDAHSVLTFQIDDAAGVSFIADPETDRRFVPVR